MGRKEDRKARRDARRAARQAAREQRRQDQKKGKFSRTGEVLTTPTSKTGNAPIDLRGDRDRDRDKDKTKDPIILKPDKKFDIKEFRERKTIGGKLVKAATSLKTTAVLGTILAGVTGAGLATGAIKAGAGLAKATVTATTAAHRLIRTKLPGTRNVLQSERLVGLGTRTATRNFVGRPAKTGVDKIFNVANRATATRFATNTKSTALTKSWLAKIGGSGVVITLLGSYPFSAFIKQEALQQLGFAQFTASEEGDLEGLDRTIEEVEKILTAEPWEKILFAIPYVNVVKQVKDFLGAVEVNLEIRKRQAERLRQGKLTPENQRWEDIRQESILRDEEKQASIEESRKIQEERDIGFEEAEEERIERQEERDLNFLEQQEGRDLKDRQDSAYFEVLRQMKSPFPDGTPVEEIDQEIVALARQSNLFLGQF